MVYIFFYPTAWETWLQRDIPPRFPRQGTAGERRFPAAEVQRQLALDLSTDAKSMLRPLSSYVHTRAQTLSHQRVSEHT